MMIWSQWFSGFQLLLVILRWTCRCPPWNKQFALVNGWLEYSFPFRMAHFQGRTVSFRECNFQGCITISRSKRTKMLEVELLLPIPACLFGGLHAVAWLKFRQKACGPSLKLTWLRDLDLLPTFLFPFTLVCFRCFCCFLAWYITIKTTMWWCFCYISSSTL